ncbi:hypothetical protein lbkm_0502 [Lachnospiraceae bacterium KM106-2]|nr:hypothetical protein lbkm_0502 [Lachnospiraceae bacterium KM106-2]
MMNALRRFMYGRYGTDQLSIGLLGLCVLTNIISLFTPYRVDQILYLVYYFSFVYCIFRILSRNYDKRRKENQKFLGFWNPISYKFKQIFHTNEVKDHNHRYYTCKNCKQRIRVPKGKGQIEITCPRCKYQFIKRT